MRRPDSALYLISVTAATLEIPRGWPRLAALLAHFATIASLATSAVSSTDPISDIPR